MAGANKKTEQIADRLHSAAIHLLRRVRKEDAASQQAPARLSALSVLVFGGAMTLGELAAAEQVKPPTMTRIVTGLERNKLAERVTDPEDARRVRIRATARGERLLQEARRKRVRSLAGQLEKLGKAELQELEQTVQVLNRVLQEWE